MKNNSLEGLNSRPELAEERICELEDRSIETLQSEEQWEKIMKKNKQNLREMWDTIKYPKIQIIGVPEGKESKEGAVKYLKT